MRYILVNPLVPKGLELSSVTSGYGDSVVLEDVSFFLGAGDSLAVLGRNGAGKSTLLGTIMGLTKLHRGRVAWCGRDLSRLSIYQRVHSGIGWVPQERLVFPSLTVEEHLTSVIRPGGWSISRVYQRFPALGQRRRNWGRQLSGGEQQMLAIARALITNPAVLLLDEPLEGLAPLIVQDLVHVIRELVASGDATVILVEQHARQALEMTRSAMVIERGRVIHSSISAALLESPDKLDSLLAVGAGA